MRMTVRYRDYPWFDPGDEEAFPLAEAKHHGIYRSHQTLRRWALEGVEHPVTKEVVVLRVCKFPDGVYTTKEEYQRFIRRLNVGEGE